MKGKGFVRRKLGDIKEGGTLFYLQKKFTIKSPLLQVNNAIPLENSTNTNGASVPGENNNNREYILDDDECPLAILMNHPQSRGKFCFSSYVHENCCRFSKKILSLFSTSSFALLYSFLKNINSIENWLTINVDLCCYVQVTLMFLQHGVH